MKLSLMEVECESLQRLHNKTRHIETEQKIELSKSKHACIPVTYQTETMIATLLLTNILMKSLNQYL